MAMLATKEGLYQVLDKKNAEYLEQLYTSGEFNDFQLAMHNCAILCANDMAVHSYQAMHAIFDEIKRISNGAQLSVKDRKQAEQAHKQLAQFGRERNSALVTAIKQAKVAATLEQKRTALLEISKLFNGDMPLYSEARAKLQLILQAEQVFRKEYPPADDSPTQVIPAVVIPGKKQDKKDQKSFKELLDDALAPLKPWFDLTNWERLAPQVQAFLSARGTSVGQPINRAAAPAAAPA